MTDEQVEAAGEAAEELLDGSDAMDPGKATREQSRDFVRGIRSWAQTWLAAFDEDDARDEREAEDDGE